MTYTMRSAQDQPASRLEWRLLEALGDLYDDFVDPADRLYDADGSRMTPIGPAASGTPGAGLPFSHEAELAEVRSQCRALALTNEFAINGHDYPMG